MANSLLKLTVESSEYDAKLKKAAEGIRHLADVAHKSDGDLTGLEKSTLDYIKSVGDMETKSRSAAGQVRELESTYKELKVIYDQLNDVEKADEGGKALAASLEQLKQRAQDAKKSLDDASKSLQQNEDSAKEDSGALEKLASKFVVNVDALKLFNIGLQAAGVALDVAKDAFMSSETNVDDWGRTVRSAEGIYQSFVQSLNTGDFTGFLNNIGRVTQAAQEAYNALDELGTRMTIINPERARLQARQQELRADIRRNGADSEVGKAALAELKKIEPLLSKSFKTESQMNYTAFEKLVRERLAEGGINLDQKSFQQFMKTFSSDAAFQNLSKNARGSSELRETSEIGKFRTVDTRNTEQKLLDLFTDEWRQANSGYLTASFSAQGAAASNALGNARYMRAGSGGGNGGNGGKTITEEKDDFVEINGLINMATERVNDLQKRIREAPTESIITELRDQLKDAQAELDRLNGKDLKIQPEEMTFTAAQLEGMSFDNPMPTTRGNSGKAQDKLDLATAAFATGGTSNIDFSNYTAALQNAIKDANIDSELYAQLSEQLSDSSQVSQLLQQYVANGITGADLGQTAQELKAKLMNGEINDDVIQQYVDELNAKLMEKFDETEWPNVLITFDADTKNIVNAAKQQEKDAQKMAKNWQAAGSAIQAVGQAMNVIEDPAAKVLGTIAQAVASVALGAANAMKNYKTFTGWDWIAFAAASTATMISTIASIHSATGYANGGIYDGPSGFVPGNSFSGDNVMANGGTVGLNSGELILNRAQQGVLADALHDNNQQPEHSAQPYLDGELIYLGLQAYLRRAGMGEIVTANR